MSYYEDIQAQVAEASFVRELEQTASAMTGLSD